MDYVIKYSNYILNNVNKVALLGQTKKNTCTKLIYFL